MANQNILFTGFEAFANWDVNPTAVATEVLNGTSHRNFNIIGEIIPLRLKEIQPKLKELVELYNPSAIIMSGQAGGDKIRLERFAQNELKSKAPYNCGTITTGQLIEKNGIEVLDSALPLQEYYEVLTKHNIPVRMSDSAGKFGCNQIFYHSRFDFPNLPSGFIHVPLLKEQVSNDQPCMDQEIITQALELICHSTIDFVIN